MVSHTQSSNGQANRRVREITRGVGTEMIYKRSGKLKVSIDAVYKKFVGINAARVVNEFATNVKNDAPVEGVTGWKQVNQSVKDGIIESVLEKFDIAGYGVDKDVDEVIYKTCKRIYTNWKSGAHQHYIDNLAKENPYEHPFPTMSDDKYAYMIDHVWNSDKFKKRSQVNKLNREKLVYNHKMGSKSYAAALHAKDEAEIPQETDYIELFKSSRYNPRTRKWVDASCEQKYIELKESWKEAKEAGVEISMRELFQQVLGKEFSYFGKKSPTPTIVSNKEHEKEVQILKDTINDMTKSFEEKLETQQKTIEAQNKRIEENQIQQVEFMKMMMLYRRQNDGSSSSMSNVGE